MMLPGRMSTPEIFMCLEPLKELVLRDGTSMRFAYSAPPQHERTEAPLVLRSG